MGDSKEVCLEASTLERVQGHLSAWLVKHGLVHRSLGLDYQGIKSLQIKHMRNSSIDLILGLLPSDLLEFA